MGENMLRRCDAVRREPDRSDEETLHQFAIIDAVWSCIHCGFTAPDVVALQRSKLYKLGRIDRLGKAVTRA